MRSVLASAAPVAMCIALGLGGAGRSSAQNPPLEVRDRQGATLKTLNAADLPTAVNLQAEPADCPPAEPGHELRESRGPGFSVDSCGRVRGSQAAGRLENHEATPAPSSAAASLTIDRMTTRVTYGSYAPGGHLTLCGSADAYSLSDGSSWTSGAGSVREHWSQPVGTEVNGTTIRYTLSPPEVNLVYEQTDYDSGEHSSQGRLAAAGPLVIEAQAGATTAVLNGLAVVTANDPTWYGQPRFNYFSAVVGAVVPFQITYVISGTTWQADTFTESFSYTSTGFVDFAHPVSLPHAVELTFSGAGRLPGQSTAQYRAAVRYDSGVTRDATANAGWTVTPASLASVAGGLLTVGTPAASETSLTLSATFVAGTDSLAASKTVRCLAADPVEGADRWPMYQANARHTGYVPVSLGRANFTLKWKKPLSTLSLNPVAAGEGKVFATVRTYFNDVTHLFALSSNDGSLLWSKRFTGQSPGIFSVNPPSFAYGNVYVQTGDHSRDTWLHAFDGTTGEELFRAPHEAQWERYFAPTVYAGKVYVNGGYYGGMYGFDAYSGAQLWYTTLPQYDQWTPAVDGDVVYAYVGQYTPGLYVKDRLTGAPAPSFVADANFEWDGWSMNLAPVVGAHGDVVAVHDGRLISFSPGTASIRWELASAFTGQPSVAKDRIYAIDGGSLVVLDEISHATLWSWSPPAGALAGSMIVTDTHVLASTAAATYAIDLGSHQSVWSYPAAGNLALADGVLFISSSDGSLTAFAASSQSSFHTVAPCRVVDTRRTAGVPVGGPALQGNQRRVLHVAGSCGIPTTARAVALNVTATESSVDGDIRLYPGDVQTLASTINYARGRTRANNAIIPLTATGDLTAWVDQGASTSVHVVIDVTGYFE